MMSPPFLAKPTWAWERECRKQHRSRCVFSVRSFQAAAFNTASLPIQRQMRNSCARRRSHIVRRCISLLCLTLHLYLRVCTMPPYIKLNKQQRQSEGGEKTTLSLEAPGFSAESIFHPSSHQFSISAYPALKLVEVLESVPVIVGG